LINGGVFGFPRLNKFTIKDDYIFFTASIAQANEYVANLQFYTEIVGEYEIVVTVWDNGNSGKYCPPPGVSTSTNCPRASSATLYVGSLTNANVITGIATGVGAGVLALAAVGALLGAKFFKPTESPAWDEWAQEDMEDIAMSNPTFVQDTLQGESLIYQN